MQSPGWICAGRVLHVIHFLNSQVVAFQTNLLSGCLLSVFAQKRMKPKCFLVGSCGVVVINAQLHCWLGLGGGPSCGIPFFSLPCLRRKCTMSPLTELVMTKTITYTWRELLMISKHFHIWPSICCSYQACEINKAGPVAPCVQMRKQSQSARGFPGGHPLH